MQSFFNSSRTEITKKLNATYNPFLSKEKKELLELESILEKEKRYEEKFLKTSSLYFEKELEDININSLLKNKLLILFYQTKNLDVRRELVLFIQDLYIEYIYQENELVEDFKKMSSLDTANASLFRLFIREYCPLDRNINLYKEHRDLFLGYDYTIKTALYNLATTRKEHANDNIYHEFYMKIINEGIPDENIKNFIPNIGKKHQTSVLTTITAIDNKDKI